MSNAALGDGHGNMEDPFSECSAGVQRSRSSTIGQRVDGRNLGLRIATSVILAVLSFVVIFLGVVPFAIEASLFAWVGILEFCNLAEKSGLKPSRHAALAGGMVVLGAATIAPEAWLGYILASTMLFTMACGVLRGRGGIDTGRPRYIDAMATMFAYLYVAWLFSFIILMRRTDGHFTVQALQGMQVATGAVWVVLFIVATSLCDIGSFVVGKCVGRTPLAPHVSPNKTVEGAIGGLLTSTLGVVVLGQLFGIPLLNAALYAFVVALFGQLGDLWESMVKREAGVKDSGSLLLGHGGVLDRFDSYLFASPVAYFLTMLLLQH